MRTLSSISLALAAALAVAGCQYDATSPLELQAAGPPISVIPSFATLDGGTFLRLTATVRRSDGSTFSPAGVTWRSADGAIASVATDGMIQGLKAGQVQIVATWQDSRGSSMITVLDPVTKKPPAGGD